MKNCKNYINGCGNCPMIASNNPNDFTHKNFLERSRIVRKLEPIVMVNKQMNEIFNQSDITHCGYSLHNISMIIDLDKFKPNYDIREKYNIGNDKFILFFGCQNLTDERKGISYLIDALNILRNKLNKNEASKIMIITAGKDNSIIVDSIHFEQKHFGYVDGNQLPELYNLANVFLSPSIDDAGPSMVNQSLACGTPVISFEIGTALEVVKDQGSGFCVPLKDTQAFADKIIEIFKMDGFDYLAMREKSRAIAEKYHSYKYFLDVFNQSISEV